MNRRAAGVLLLIVAAALLLSACPVHRGPGYHDDDSRHMRQGRSSRY